MIAEFVPELLAFACVVVVVLAIAQVMGAAKEQRFRTRLVALKDTAAAEQPGSLLRSSYLRQLSPLERALEQFPGMPWLAELCQQAGRDTPAYRVALLSLLLAACGAVIGLSLLHIPLIALAAAVLCGVLPPVKLTLDRRQRLHHIEEQLPDALALMARALRAGNPLVEAFKFIADEMPPPIRLEFSHLWSNVSYGVPLKEALLDMLERTPCVSLRAMVTAVLVQRETGGNLAEILDGISGVLRARARFRRRVHTLTAEGRVSAIVLVVMPFSLAGAMALLTPTYLPLLLKDPVGPKLVGVALALMALGIFWISRIVRIRV